MSSLISWTKGPMRGYSAQNLEAGDAAKGGIGVRKIVADILEACSTQDRVSDGVTQHIRIGVAGKPKPLGMFELDPAKNQRPVWLKAMHVVPDATAHDHHQESS